MFISSNGSYFKEFDIAFNLLPKKTKSVIELCFGDIYIAKSCRHKNISWIGYDISAYFVNNAKKKKYNAVLVDLHKVSLKGKYDVAIITRSLYQFKSDLTYFIASILKVSSSIIICESIKSLSNSRNYLIRKFANKITHSGDKEHFFRYTKDTIKEDIKFITEKFNLNIITEISTDKTVFYLLTKNE